MADYGRDLNIGIPVSETRNVEVQNFSGVIASVDSIEGAQEVAIEELKKIKTGTGLAIGVDLDEEAE